MISQILGAVMLIYLLAAILFLMAELWSSARLQEGGRITLWLGLGLHTGALLGRWWQSYHLALGHTPAAAWADKLQLIVIQAPLSNFYESLIFFAWCLPALGLLTFRRYLKGYLGALVALLSTLLLAYASFGVDSSIKPLMPALKSNWLLIHVVTAFLGYAAFALAFGPPSSTSCRNGGPGHRSPLCPSWMASSTGPPFWDFSCSLWESPLGRCGPKPPGAATGAGTPRKPGR